MNEGSSSGISSKETKGILVSGEEKREWSKTLSRSLRSDYCTWVKNIVRLIEQVDAEHDMQRVRDLAAM